MQSLFVRLFKGKYHLQLSASRYIDIFLSSTFAIIPNQRKWIAEMNHDDVDAAKPAIPLQYMRHSVRAAEATANCNSGTLQWHVT